MRKSQTATEYLILLAVVIVVALVVVNTMGGFPGIGASSGKKVSDLKLASDVVGVSSFSIGTNYSLFNFRNNNYDTITITEFRINQQANLTCNSSNTVPSLPIVLNIGQSILVNCSAVNSTNYVLTDKQTPVVGILYSDNLGAARTAGNVQSYNSTNLNGAQSLNSNKSILSFNITNPVSVVGVINETNHSISISVPFGTIITAINTSIAISDNTTINLSSGIVVDFTNPVNYTVTAQDGSTQTYVVTVSVGTYQSGMFIAAAAWNNTIYVSSDFGVTWSSKNSIRNWSALAMSSDGSRITVGEYNGPLYISSDFGNTWVTAGANKQWMGLSMSADGRYQTASLYSDNLYVSSDYGATWTPKSVSALWYSIAMSSNGQYQTAGSWMGDVYGSNDSGSTWVVKLNKTTLGGNRFWTFTAMSSNGSKQYVSDAVGKIYVSNDSGVSWGVLCSGKWSGLATSSDGSVVASASFPNPPNNGSIYESSDYGVTRISRSQVARWDLISMSSDGSRQVASASGLSGGSANYIYVSSDSGTNWNQVAFPAKWYGLAISK